MVLYSRRAIRKQLKAAGWTNKRGKWFCIRRGLKRITSCGVSLRVACSFAGIEFKL